MPSRADSDRRKAKDAALRSQDDAIADHLAEAMRSGELKSAPSFGKPMADAEGWSETPIEFRLPFKILKNAGVIPPEVELFHQRAQLRQQLEAASTESQRALLRQRLSELEQVIALRLESLRSGGRL